MTETASETGLGAWQVPECPFRIEYAPPILDELRRIGVDAYFALPRGGAEIGGILLGTHRRDSVRIVAYRPTECEHAHGPGFVLSDNDRARLSALLDEPQHDPTLRGLEVVGWYHTHTRSEIFLSELDLKIYREFFPEPWQIALVLRPNGMKPTRAGFFFREANGSIRSSASYQEFTAGAHPAAVAPVGAAKVVNGRQTVAPAAVPSAPRVSPEPQRAAPPPRIAPLPHIAPPPPRETPTPHIVPTPPSAAVPMARTIPALPPAAVKAPALVPASALIPAPQEKIIPPADQPKPHPVEAEAPAKPESSTHTAPLPPATALLPPKETVPAEGSPSTESRPVEFVPPSFLVPPAPSKSKRWIWIPLLLFAGGGAGAYFGSTYWTRWQASRPVNLHLQALDRGGQLGIQWDRNALVSRSPSGGMLEIVDGASNTKIPLDPAELRSGAFLYDRRSEMVAIHMSVNVQGGAVEEFTSFIGQKPAPPTAAVEPAPPPVEAADAEKAREDLKKQELRTLELEQNVKRMRALLRSEDARKRAENQVPASPAPAVESRSASRSTQPVPPASNGASGNPIPNPASAQPANPAGSNPQTTSQPTGTASPQTPAASPPQAERQMIPAPRPAVSAERAAPAPSSVVTAPQPPQPSLTGSWVFSPATKTGSPFTPESVTLAMTEAYGQVRGVFVGRYRVPKNRKFNPRVKFNFEGPVHPGSSKFSFSAADGMRGEIELIRLPGKQDAIEVVWYSDRDKLTFDDIFFRRP